jgi:hypothetical protein
LCLSIGIKLINQYYGDDKNKGNGAFVYLIRRLIGVLAGGVSI